MVLLSQRSVKITMSSLEECYKVGLTGLRRHLLKLRQQILLLSSKFLDSVEQLLFAVFFAHGALYTTSTNSHASPFLSAIQIF